MRVRVQVIVEGDDETPSVVHEVAHIERGDLHIDRYAPPAQSALVVRIGNLGNLPVRAFPIRMHAAGAPARLSCSFGWQPDRHCRHARALTAVNRNV